MDTGPHRQRDCFSENSERVYMKWIRFLLIGVLMSTVFRLQGLPDELRMQIEEASGGTITTEAARLIIERSVREAQTVFDTALNNITKEVQGIVGPHGSITRMQAGGINISRGDGFSVYADGVIKTSIDPRGNVFIGSDLTQPSTTTELFFVEEYIYNGELFGAGDFLIGDNTSGQSNVKWDASEGQLQFRGGITTKAYMDTDGTLKAAGGGIVLDSSALKIVNLTDASDPFIIFYNSSGTALGQILTNSSGNLELDAFGAAGAERKLILRSIINAISADSNIEIIANSANSGVDWITLNTDVIALEAAVIVNGAGADKDFRLEGDTDEYLIFVDASTNRVGISQPTPAHTLDVDGEVNTNNWYYVDSARLPLYLPFGSYDSLSSGMTVDGSNPFVATVDRTFTFASWAQAARVATTNDGSNYWRIQLLRLSDGSTINEITTSAMSADTWTHLTDSTFAIATLGTSGVGAYIHIVKQGTPGALSLSSPLIAVYY
jgi:hypothetical protein